MSNRECKFEPISGDNIHVCNVHGSVPIALVESRELDVGCVLCLDGSRIVHSMAHQPVAERLDRRLAAAPLKTRRRTVPQAAAVGQSAHRRGWLGSAATIRRPAASASSMPQHQQQQQPQPHPLLDTNGADGQRLAASPTKPPAAASPTKSPAAAAVGRGGMRWSPGKVYGLQSHVSRRPPPASAAF
eukprot:TRINITY_DN2360_c1_g1_i2.p1 TRINITY_DN2360_c1_g1~~TRINITY_DN2360_c1_g1_i2.p1  ORF type:complete len:187 (-),score=46.07 TRINITY_DN2360_c1_g1_i2:161-721(-)